MMARLCLPPRRVLVYKTKCADASELRTEEISAAFDETAMAEKACNIKEVLDELFRSHGYELLEICSKRTISVTPTICGHSDTQKRKCDWCPLHMPGAPPLLCTLDCGEYERGCYAIRNS